MEKPKINLYSYFSRKEQFDFDRETYDCAVIFINISGSFQYRINSSAPYVAKAGEVVYCPPFCSFQRKVITPIELHMIKFEGSLPRGEYIVNSRIRDDLKAISYITLSKEPEGDPVLAHYCRDIIYALSHKADGFNTAPIIKFINENYNRPISNADLCDVLHCSEVSMISQIKSLTGKTPKQYINEKRIEAAKEILLSSDSPIAEVSLHCGFDDALYFSKVFRKHTAMSPSEFKSKFRL